MINKGLLSQLIQTQALSNLEQHLIYSYLQKNNLNFYKSPILLDYLNNFKCNTSLCLDIEALNISSLKDLENYLEMMIPLHDRKVNGAFFTPDYIVDFIIKEIQPEETDTNLDPSCGCGAFLIGLAKYYKKKFNKPIQKIIRENIFGSDIVDYNILRSKIILSIYALQHGEYLEETDFNLYCQDSLRTDWEQQFDNVMGNPPYVKFQDLSESNRGYLANHWVTVDGGTFNLYFAFFELGYKLLKPTGKLGYITPNSYFTSLAGEALRRYFQQRKCISRIIDFSHKKVFDVQTYTAITFLNKQQNEAITYDRIKDNCSLESFLEKANGSPNYLKNLNAKKWRLLKDIEQQNIQKIETIGDEIGKLFDICVGIATLKDEVFFIDGRNSKNGYLLKNTEKGTFEIEEDSVKTVYKISDFKTQKDIEQNFRKIIFPYQIRNGVATPIREDEFKRKFPKCYEYLISEKEVLLSRDKGKVKFEPFYVWGRTQGITKSGKKILNPTFSQHPRFLLVYEEDAYFTNGYGIYFKEQEANGLFSDMMNPISRVENIDVVQKILNSVVMDYYISKTSISIEGGYPCYQKNFIEKFTIPTLTESEIETIRNLADKELIDDFLIHKYHLNLPAPNLAE